MSIEERKKKELVKAEKEAKQKQTSID